jgi:hypothetical protein
MKNALVVALVLASSFAWAGDDVTVEVTSTSKTSPTTVSAASDTSSTQGQAWSALGGKTLAPGANQLEADVGYPAISGSFLRGVAPGFNVGARLGFVYGVEGMVRESGPGFKAQALLKVRLLDSGQISIGVVFEPGFFTYSSYLQGARVGLALPVGFRLGIAASSALAIGIHVDVPMWVEFGQFGGFNLPILTGGGVEYFITSELAAFARVRVGPTIRTLRPAEVTFDAAIGIAWRF